MAVKLIDNVSDGSRPFKWHGVTYHLKYTIYSEIKLRELYPGGIGAFAAALKKAEGNEIDRVMMLIGIFAILLNQQIAIKNIEERTDVPTVTAEYLLMVSSAEQVQEMMVLVYELLTEALPKGREANAAESELDELAGENAEKN